MQFHNGQLVHATFGNLIGEAAVYVLVAWTEGVFLIDFERVECPRTITHSTQSVLLEALRRFDESQRDAEALRSTRPKPQPRPVLRAPSRQSPDQFTAASGSPRLSGILQFREAT